MISTRSALASTLAVGVALAASAAWGGEGTDRVRASVDQVLKLMQDPELRKPANAEKRRAQIREMARGLFDFEEMARQEAGAESARARRGAAPTRRPAAGALRRLRHGRRQG